MLNGLTPVIIDNTNLSAWEMKPYVETVGNHPPTNTHTHAHTHNTHARTHTTHTHARTQHAHTHTHPGALSRLQDRDSGADDAVEVRLLRVGQEELSRSASG